MRTTKKLLASVGLLSVCLLLITGYARAQSNQGAISGLVTDSSGATVSGAAIVARNLATGQSASTVSSSAGDYHFPSLQIGNYDVTITARGFRKLEKTNVTVIFITHDMPLVSDFADRTVVMYAGKVAEIGTTAELFNNSRHPYSYALIHAVPTIYGNASDVRSIPGSPPDLINRISGCGFRTRCAYAQKICEEQEPPLTEVRPGHLSACHYAETLPVYGAEEGGSPAPI